MKRNQKILFIFLLFVGLNLNAQSKLNYLKQKIGDRLTELVPIKFKYTLVHHNYTEKKSSLVSYQITDVDVQSKKFFKIKGTFIVDKTDTFPPDMRYPINKENLMFKFEATGKQILDDYEVINIIYFDDKTKPNSSWKELYNNE